MSREQAKVKAMVVISDFFELAAGETQKEKKENAKKCALILINDQMEVFKNIFLTDGSLFWEYLQQTKEEIENF